MSAGKIDEIRNEVLAAIKLCEASPSPFAWPDDSVAHQGWAYDLHVAWIKDWDKTNRAENACRFLREWLTEDNISGVLKGVEETGERKQAS